MKFDVLIRQASAAYPPSTHGDELAVWDTLFALTPVDAQRLSEDFSP
ncbi:MAG: hypothetical protein ACP5JG_01410 [Anaerolineae bacterium]